MSDVIDTLTIELADLTPVQLDRLVLEYPHRLPYRSQLYAREMRLLAGALLDHESPGDAMARVMHYAQDPPPRPSRTVDPVSHGAGQMFKAIRRWWRGLKSSGQSDRLS